MSGLDSTPLWSPDPATARATAMARFFADVAGRQTDAPAADAPYAAWHAWSVREAPAFWAEWWQSCDLMAERAVGAVGAAGADRTPWSTILADGDVMRPPSRDGGPRWFTGARLNYAEHLLRRRDESLAIIARDERGRRRTLSFAQLADAVARASRALRQAGVQPGDRVAGFLPNIPEAVISALAANAIGAVWSSCSPDFGAGGVLDRFGQIAPKVLVVADGYTYAGKRLDCLNRVREIAREIPALRMIVVVPFLEDALSADALRTLLPSGQGEAIAWDDFLVRGGAGAPEFARLPFDHPLFIMFSSGTTGLPKCMVHGQGGTLLQHLKEHRLHCDLRAGDRLFYFTTCGWMMWNWLISALASEVTIVLYDGAPMPAGDEDALWDLVAAEGVTHFGTSAKFLALSQKAGHAPARTHALGALRAILSTGSPLAEHSYDFVYREVKSDVHLASISGGTDLISCFALGNPMLPVWRGELQCIGLGMAVEVWDEAGNPVRGVAGELVCTRPFPSMPVAFWNDADGTKYRNAYFDHYRAHTAGVWRHGDWAEVTAHDGLIIYGRSDATLNPGGVRIGTAEIYREVEQLEEIIESIVVGQDIVTDGEKDVRIVLFVRLREGLTLDEPIRDRIRKAIRARTSPHHVPRVIVQIADIPRTISNKISEIAVRDVIHGRAVKNTDALANPDALALYRDLPELRLG